MRRRFLRRTDDKVLGGVCSGLADYVDADVTLVRLISLLGILASGVLPGLLLYLICVIVVPPDSQAERNGSGYTHFDAGNSSNDAGSTDYDNVHYERQAHSSGNTRYVVGICLILFGAFILGRMFFGWIRWEYVFAGILIIGGLFMLFGNRRND